MAAEGFYIQFGNGDLIEYDGTKLICWSNHSTDEPLLEEAEVPANIAGQICAVALRAGVRAGVVAYERGIFNMTEDTVESVLAVLEPEVVDGTV